MYKTITNYCQINIIKDALIVLDIDETILKFKDINQEWWVVNYNEHYKLYDIKTARELVLNKWIEIISCTQPKILDESKFNKLLNKASLLNCKIVFLTARDPILSQITKQNLNSCNITINPNDIYYSKTKGTELMRILNKYPLIKDIIFVDDVIYNLENVYNKFNNFNHDYNINLYLMNHENINIEL